MMPVVVTCECGRQLRAKDEYIGMQATCPDCGRQVLIRETSPLPFTFPSESSSADSMRVSRVSPREIRAWIPSAGLGDATVPAADKSNKDFCQEMLDSLYARIMKKRAEHGLRFRVEKGDVYEYWIQITFSQAIGNEFLHQRSVRITLDELSRRFNISFVSNARPVKPFRALKSVSDDLLDSLILFLVSLRKPKRNSEWHRVLIPLCVFGVLAMLAQVHIIAFAIGLIASLIAACFFVITHWENWDVLIQPAAIVGSVFLCIGAYVADSAWDLDGKLCLPVTISVITFWIVIKLRSRTFSLDRPRPKALLKEYRPLSYWNALLPGLGPQEDSVRARLRDELLQRRFPDTHVAQEYVIEWGGYHLEESREWIKVSHRRAVVLIAVFNYGDDLYVSWDSYLNASCWMRRRVQRQRPFFKLTRAMGSWSRALGSKVDVYDYGHTTTAMTEYDYADVSALGQLVHGVVEPTVRRLAKENDIEKQIDSQPVQGQRIGMHDTSTQAKTTLLNRIPGLNLLRRKK